LEELMKTIGAYEAKARFSRLLREVAATGEEYVVERRGRKMARIVPCRSRRKEGGLPPEKVKEIIEGFARIRASFKPGPRFNVKEAIEWGRL
jgi:prevent-host-death family protein